MQGYNAVIFRTHQVCPASRVKKSGIHFVREHLRSSDN